GNALNRNPLPFRSNRMFGIPCHRVIASDGSLGGFSAGLKLKKQLLDLEKTGLYLEV
ncbi:MAG: MGMT family protein, partial [Candidatus Omnitrophica bacterium]|nr:MGMT family protein [Candidatus Omnitrophota bacterium]